MLITAFTRILSHYSPGRYLIYLGSYNDIIIPYLTVNTTRATQNDNK